MTRRGAGAPGAGLLYLGSEDQERIMKTLGLAILAVLAVGCDDGAMMTAPDAGPDAGADTIPRADTGALCGFTAGSYETHWERQQGTCAASGDLSVTVTNPGDLCGAITDVPVGLGQGEFSIGCYIDTAACHVFAAVGFHGCQGDYSITFAPQ